ncbi:MAG: hypothetical protein F4Y02_06615 [Chloroflexi bacterium]|nr:hypothetical protein [Chloroflexota bacterium]
MADYYVNDRAQDNGDHEVHEDGCYWLGLAKSTTYLGNFSSCHGAVRKAKTIYRQSNGCKHCSLPCHTT